MVTHGEFLRAATHDHALVAALQQDHWALASLDDKDRALLSFARKLNDTPGDVISDDIDSLRASGLTDQNIFDVVAIVAYFNFMNRIADGVGIVLESWKQESYDRHRKEGPAAHPTPPATNPP